MSSISTEEQRAQVAAAYSGEKWKRKVARMTSTQIYAIWCRLFNDKLKEEVPIFDART